MESNMVKQMMKWVQRHWVEILAVALCVIWLYGIWQPTQASDAKQEVWDMDTLVAAHSLVDWQLRAIDDGELCREGEYGLWCPFEDDVTKERFWLGPYVSDLGEVIIVDSFCAQNHTSVTYEIVVMYHTGTEWANLANEVFVPRYKWICIDHAIPLQSGDRLGAWFRGATSTDDLKVNILWHTIARK